MDSNNIISMPVIHHFYFGSEFERDFDVEWDDVILEKEARCHFQFYTEESSISIFVNNACAEKKPVPINVKTKNLRVCFGKSIAINK